MSIKRIPPRIIKTSAAMQTSRHGSENRFGSENKNGSQGKAILSAQAKATTPKK